MARQGDTIDLVAFGNRGLWTSAEKRILPPAYCTQATNLRLSSGGALELRKGYSDQTTTELSSKNILALHEYIKADETTEIIVAWDGGLANSIDDPAGNDISGAVTVANGNWFFQNFNDKCIGFQEGQKLAVYTGSGSFATVTESSGTAPTGGVGCAAYGRIWQADADGHTIYYSGLLDETDWGGSGSGSIDLNNIWTNGQDTIRAIRGFNGALIVWGKRHVIFFGDSAGSELGVSPTNLYVQDIIAGTGCINQTTVQLVGEEDIVFCSNRGVQSLARLIQERSNPIETLSQKVEQELVDDINDTIAANRVTVRSAYSVKEGLYILTFPFLSTTYVLEMRHLYQDEIRGVRAPVFKWDLAPYSWLVRDNGDILLGVLNKVGKFENHQDDSADISWRWDSPWLDFGEDFANRLKILKRLALIVTTSWGGSIVVRWAVDFKGFNDSSSFTITDTSNNAEFNLAEFGVGEFGGDSTLQTDKKRARKTGQYYRFSLSATTNKQLTLQQLEFFYKLGRIA